MPWWFDIDAVKVIITCILLTLWLRSQAARKTEREQFVEMFGRLDKWQGCSAGCENCCITCERDTRRIWE